LFYLHNSFKKPVQMETSQILNIREKHFLPTVTHYYKKPLHIAKASMQWVWDAEGKRYLDAFAGILTVSAGHNHPQIKKRLKSWMDEDRPQHSTTLYLTEPMAELAAALTGIAPADLKRVFFTNSGSEANEMAILLARHYTKRTEIIALKHAYHGATAGAMSLVGLYNWKWGGPEITGVHHAAQPNCYRCPFGATPESCALECAEDVERTIQSSTSGEIAAFIGEPIQGVGGFIVPPSGYYERVHKIVKKYGGVFISDEVQTGVGRTGRHWFGILHEGITPDIMTLAKGFGNGASIGGAVVREEIASSFKGKLHLNTFAANPWTTLQAHETLKILEEEQVLAKAEQLGKVLIDGLNQIKKDCALVGDVRGRGLMVGVELVKDRKTKAYATEETLEVMEVARTKGLLIGRGGLHANVLRVSPPLCIGEADVHEILRILGETLREVEKQKPNGV
jgi:alanine-glyoxylate transaminase/(R)-3-amino-2-methylpropionate-pyruvate transaminase